MLIPERNLTSLSPIPRSITTGRPRRNLSTGFTDRTADHEVLNKASELKTDEIIATGGHQYHYQQHQWSQPHIMQIAPRATVQSGSDPVTLWNIRHNLFSLLSFMDEAYYFSWDSPVSFFSDIQMEKVCIKPLIFSRNHCYPCVPLICS